MTRPPMPRDEAEVPEQLRNPMSSTFLQRVLLHYQVMPTGHPYNPEEVALSPDDLKAIEEMGLLPECEKVKTIVYRDKRWQDLEGPEQKKMTQAKTLPKAGTPEHKQHQIAVDTVKNPAKGLLGGPSATEAEKILRTKFKYSDAEIKKLKG